MDTQEDKCRDTSTLKAPSRSTTTLLTSFATALQLNDPWHIATQKAGNTHFTQFTVQDRLPTMQFHAINQNLATHATSLYPTMPPYQLHCVTLDLHLLQKFGASPNSWPGTATSRKPYMRHGLTTSRPMPRAALTPTCSGM